MAFARRGCAGDVVSTVRGRALKVVSYSGPTPPGPPLTRGGKVMLMQRRSSRRAMSGGRSIVAFRSAKGDNGLSEGGKVMKSPSALFPDGSPLCRPGRCRLDRASWFACLRPAGRGGASGQRQPVRFRARRPTTAPGRPLRRSASRRMWSGERCPRRGSRRRWAANRGVGDVGESVLRGVVDHVRH